jgi:DNA-binding winged helix-turn-helix (wHTH) protein/Tfp pilus assembly protein PilF
MKVPRILQMKSKENPKTLASTTTSPVANHVYYFGSYCLNQTEQQLLRNGEAVRLAPKAFDVLLVLIQNKGCLVTKDKLMAEVWPDAFVEEANLSVNIACLRKALDDGNAERKYIETVPKRGYRFVARLSEPACESAPVLEELQLIKGQNDSERNQLLNSLAVLPFENEGCGPAGQYLAGALTESITNSLSQWGDLRVMARNTVYSCQRCNVDPRTVGHELRVRSVLAGRILQLGDKLIVRTELVDVINGWQLWGEEYQTKVSDILIIQQEITAEISERLRTKLSVNNEKPITKPRNSEACNLYLKGRYHWNKYAQKSLGLAIEYFRRAIEVDPTYALAYAGLADSYHRLSDNYLPTAETMPLAKLAATKALEIDETLAEAHTALGMVWMFYSRDWSAAEQEFSRAIELNPRCSMAHQRLALYLSLLGRFDEAKSEIHMAIELDPLSLHTSQAVALQFFLTGDFEQAIEQQEKTLETNPNYHPGYYVLGWVYKRKGDLAKAIDSFVRATVLDDCPLLLGALAHAYGLNGNRIKALSILDELEEQSKRRYVSSYSRAVAYIGLDEKDQAFYWLDKALEDGSAMLTWLKVGWESDGLRADPRFPDLLRRAGFPS